MCLIQTDVEKWHCGLKGYQAAMPVTHISWTTTYPDVLTVEAVWLFLAHIREWYPFHLAKKKKKADYFQRSHNITSTWWPRIDLIPINNVIFNKLATHSYFIINYLYSIVN